VSFRAEHTYTHDVLTSPRHTHDPLSTFFNTAAAGQAQPIKVNHPMWWLGSCLLVRRRPSPPLPLWDPNSTDTVQPRFNRFNPPTPSSKLPQPAPGGGQVLQEPRERHRRPAGACFFLGFLETGKSACMCGLLASIDPRPLLPTYLIVYIRMPPCPNPQIHTQHKELRTRIGHQVSDNDSVDRVELIVRSGKTPCGPVGLRTHAQNRTQLN
jgi:hypothetical protein